MPPHYQGTKFDENPIIERTQNGVSSSLVQRKNKGRTKDIPCIFPTSRETIGVFFDAFCLFYPPTPPMLLLRYSCAALLFLFFSSYVPPLILRTKVGAKSVQSR